MTGDDILMNLKFEAMLTRMRHRIFWMRWGQVIAFAMMCLLYAICGLPYSIAFFNGLTFGVLSVYHMFSIGRDPVACLFNKNAYDASDYDRARTLASLTTAVELYCKEKGHPFDKSFAERVARHVRLMAGSL